MKITLAICGTAILITFIVCSTFMSIELHKYRIRVEAAQELLRPPSLTIVPEPTPSDHL